LPTTTRTGYTLKGWYTAASGGTKISSTTKITKAITFYAQWTAASTGGATTVDASDIPYRYSMRYINQLGNPWYTTNSKYFRQTFWGDYSSKNGCGVASTSHALNYLGTNKLPSVICAANEKAGGETPVWMMWSSHGKVANDTGGLGLDDCLQRYLDTKGSTTGTSYAPPIIWIPYGTYRHYITIIGKNANGTYQKVDSAEDEINSYTKGTIYQTVQYYK
jgi:uncharacterized repeat protein (TIGR02543 family)